MRQSTQNRSFGILFFIVFLVLSFWPLTKNGSLNIYFLFISLVFLLLGLLNSRILSPLNKVWIKLGEILGKIIAPLVMAVVYFIILTPISLLVRSFGKDLIGLKFKKDINTYWIKRKKDLGSMDKQF